MFDKKDKKKGEPLKEEAKIEKVKKKADKKAFDVNKKAEAIKASKMPEAQKERYLRDIGAKVEEKSTDHKISLKVWMQVSKKDLGMAGAYKAFPKAKDVRLATRKEWDEIFKSF